MSILEAGAAGLPVVSTRHAGIPDVVVEGKTGLLVEEGGIDEMVQHMIALANNPSFADELGRNAAVTSGVTIRCPKYPSARSGVEGSCLGFPNAPVREAIEAGFAN